MTSPIPYTLLPLADFARLMGINPVHFQGAYGDSVWPLENNACSNIWPRHAWQQVDMVSREELAHAIASAERDIADVVGYWPAPTWQAQEVHRYLPYHRFDAVAAGGMNVKEFRKSVTADYGKFITAGTRALTLVGTATVAGGTLVYSDDDGDGFFETATITLPTTLTNACEINAYFAGESGDMDWEIRPIRSKAITAGGNIVLVIDSWLLVEPSLQAAFPTDAGFTAVNIDTTSNFVTSIDVYREYTDTTAVSATFYWEPDDCGVCPSCALALEGAGYILLEAGSSDTTCPACGLTAQTGCLYVRDVHNGIVVPTPGDLVNSTWYQRTFAVNRDPDIVKINYYAGDISQRWLSGRSCNALDDEWAKIITWIAVSRLERELCQCGNVTALARHLRTDLAFTGTDTSFNLPFDMLSNPFGSHRGEVMAWERVSKMGKIQYDAGTI